MKIKLLFIICLVGIFAYGAEKILTWDDTKPFPFGSDLTDQQKKDVVTLNTWTNEVNDATNSLNSYKLSISGTIPMVGNLDLGNYYINNCKRIVLGTNIPAIYFKSNDAVIGMDDNFVGELFIAIDPSDGVTNIFMSGTAGVRIAEFNDDRINLHKPVMADSLSITDGNPAAGDVLRATNSSGESTWSSGPAFMAAGVDITVTYTDNDWAIVHFTNETLFSSFDTGNIFNPSTHRCTPGVLGRFIFQAHVCFDQDNSYAGEHYLGIRKNGERYRDNLKYKAAVAGQYAPIDVVFIENVTNVNDYYECWVRSQGGDNNLIFFGGIHAYFSAARLP
ncbi:hypothetical protein ACFLQL_00065 [Verrucomicrobiota bacterium]